MPTYVLILLKFNFLCIFDQSDNFYNLAVPFDGKEMDYCTFTVPLFRDKQWFWMQLTGHD